MYVFNFRKLITRAAESESPESDIFEGKESESESDLLKIKESESESLLLKIKESVSELFGPTPDSSIFLSFKNQLDC